MSDQSFEPAISDEDYRRIAAQIRNPESPVGIDAERTHVMILHKLEKLEERLTRLESGGTVGGSERRVGNSP